jgi:ribose transport system ATP-binding protein
MVGTEKELESRRTAAIDASKPPVIEIQNLTVEGYLQGVSLEAYEGEVVGLSGLVGSGRSELLETLYGLSPYQSGSVRLSGRPLSHHGPRGAIKQGVGYVPSDRKTAGVILPMAVRDNLTMPSTFDRSRLASPRSRKNQEAAAATSRLLSIKAALGAEVRTLSGGNQQKVVLGKWLIRTPKLLLLDEPTRGVDVAAKGEIHRYLRDIAAQGVTMLVSSSEYDELFEVCDRIVVFSRGRVVGTLSREEATESRLASLAGGARDECVTPGRKADR